MLDFLKKLFGLIEKTPTQKKYPLGAHESEPDIRTIDLAQVVNYTAMPLEQKTSVLAIIDVFNQLGLGTCVAHAFALVKMVLDYIETNKLVVYSRRFLYVLSRRFLGMVNTDASSNQGLPPIATAKVITTVGVIPSNILDNDTLPHSKYVDDYLVTDTMRKEANYYRTKGFANVQINPTALKNAINSSKAIPACIIIDWGAIGTDGTIGKPYFPAGLHEVVFYGWDIKNGKERFIFRNSWGKAWGTNGDGYIYTNDLNSVVIELLALADIPNSLIERAKSYQYIFLTTLKRGSKGDGVVQLQKRLIEYGLLTGNADGDFGKMTESALMQYQSLKGLSIDGIFGKKGQEAMNNDVVEKKVKAKLDLWIEAITKMEGAKPENHNPGNIRYVGQAKAIGQTSKGFCIFPDDATGYMELRNMLIRAATGQSSNYKADMTIREFYAGIKNPNRYGKEIFGYAPESDGNQPNHYADFVAKIVGVSVNTPIKDLL